MTLFYLAPTISEITASSCVFHWQTHKPLGHDTIQYTLQLQVYKKENDYSEIYRGDLTTYRVSKLEAGVDYRARVCVTRTTTEGLTLTSPFSPSTHFVLPRTEALAAAAAVSPSRTTTSDHRESQTFSLARIRSSIGRKLRSIQLFESRTLTDQQWAFVISVGFALLAIFIAIFANVIYSKYNHHSVDNAVDSSSPGLDT